MRITAFRVWFAGQVQTGIGAARRAGLAIARKVRQATGKIEEGAGVGDDEQGFRGRGSRAWVEVVEEIKKKVEQLFGRSTFERFPRLDRMLRRLFGIAPKPAALPAKIPPATSRSFKAPQPLDGAEAAKYREQIRSAVQQAHTREKAGLRDPKHDKDREPEE